MRVIKIWSVVLTILIGGTWIHLAHSVSPFFLPGTDRMDEHRQVVDPDHYPWKMIGRVQTDLGQRCTGFLIGDRMVITAAHCLWIKKTHHFIDSHSVHFLLGYHRQNFRTAYQVLNVIKSSHYQGADFNDKSLENVTQDWVYLILAGNGKPSIGLLPFNHDRPFVGMPLFIAGYEQDRQEVLYADQHCHVTRILPIENRGMILVHDCQGTFGSSGAPVLTQDAKGKWVITGIQLGAFTSHSGGIAVYLDSPPKE